MALVTGYAWWRTIEQPATAEARVARLAPSPQSIAVLPFVDMSPGGEAAYLGDGLSEELSSDLAKLPGLRVAARTSAFAFKGRDMDVRRIGEQLGVRFVLEGSVRREGERVRVTAQLIDAIDRLPRLDRQLRPAVAGPDRHPAGDLGRHRQASAHGDFTRAAQQLKAAPPHDPRAYDFYLAGLAQLRQGASMKGIGEAESLFRRSLEADPGFARAQAGLCQVAILRYERTSAAEHVVEAEAACRAALEADATLERDRTGTRPAVLHQRAARAGRSRVPLAAASLAARRRGIHRPRPHAGALESPRGGRAELPRGDHRRARLLDGLQRARRVPVRRRPQPGGRGRVPARDRARARRAPPATTTSAPRCCRPATCRPRRRRSRSRRRSSRRARPTRTSAPCTTTSTVPGIGGDVLEGHRARAGGLPALGRARRLEVVDAAGSRCGTGGLSPGDCARRKVARRWTPTLTDDLEQRVWAASSCYFTRWAPRGDRRDGWASLGRQSRADPLKSRPAHGTRSRRTVPFVFGSVIEPRSLRMMTAVAIGRERASASDQRAPDALIGRSDAPALARRRMPATLRTASRSPTSSTRDRRGSARLDPIIVIATSRLTDHAGRSRLRSNAC